MRGSTHRLVRLGLVATVAIALVAGALSVSALGLGRPGSLSDRHIAQATERATVAAQHVAAQHVAAEQVAEAEAEPHDHDDETTKNAVSRSGESGPDTEDPTNALERATASTAVAAGRQSADPPLTSVPVMQDRQRFPQDRFAMANGCYRMAGNSTFFKPTDLGTYLLYTKRGRYRTVDGVADEPSPATVWTAKVTKATKKRKRHKFVFTNDTGTLTYKKRTVFRLLRAGGCRPHPEAGVDIDGDPHAGVTSFQEVRGYVDSHTHGMAYEFLGGEAHCGKPWDPYGVEFALVDCDDHTATGGNGAVLESFLSGEPSHDPVGWPTFVDWPAPNSLTHEGTYYRWMERAWRGGLRVFTNLLVENNQLCMIYPLKRNSCDDMDSVRLQAQRMYEFQDYIDAQFGGPGKGFYRIVKSPAEAREVINSGKLAVIMGIETSLPFGCTFKNVPGVGDVPACDEASIVEQLDEVHDLGVRQMELVNKFDNALSGIAGDAGATGQLVNGANFLETGTYWDMRHCEPEDGESSDKEQFAAPDISAGQQDAIFGAILELFGTAGLPATPLYPPPAHCNDRGLTDLGEFMITELAKRNMIFDPDHMSVKARNQALDVIDRLRYQGVLSSHSWSTLDAYPRIYRQGGFITPYAGDSTGFVSKWRQHVGWADPRYYFGFGYGADINGLGSQGGPRGADVENPVTYPFTGIGGITVNKQTAGQRVWDINVDGVAQYGLYPDWIEDLRQVAGADGDAIVEDMSRGAEAYLQMWERAEGIAPDSCRNPGLRKRLGKVTRLIKPGLSTQQVLELVGQPFTRSGTKFGFCAKKPGNDNVRVVVKFNDAGQVLAVRTR
jgi:hypothetical protein